MVVFAATQKLAKGHWFWRAHPRSPRRARLHGRVRRLFVGLHRRDHIFSWLHSPGRNRGMAHDKWFFCAMAPCSSCWAWLTWRSWGAISRLTCATRHRRGRGTARRTPTDHGDAAILVLAVRLSVYSLLGYDLVMSLAHKWVSNLYGAFYFMGAFSPA